MPQPMREPQLTWAWLTEPTSDRPCCSVNARLSPSIRVRTGAAAAAGVPAFGAAVLGGGVIFGTIDDADEEPPRLPCTSFSAVLVALAAKPLGSGASTTAATTARVTAEASAPVASRSREALGLTVSPFGARVKRCTGCSISVQDSAAMVIVVAARSASSPLPPIPVRAWVRNRMTGQCHR